MLNFEVPFTKEEYTAFAGHVISKQLKIIFICFLIVLFCNVFFIIADTLVLFGLVMLGFIVFNILLLYFIYKNSSAKYIKSNPLLDGNTTISFVFDEETLTVTDKRENKEIGKTTLEYSKLHKAAMTKTYTFIYISNIQAFIIRHSALNSEQLKELKKYTSSQVKRQVCL